MTNTPYFKIEHEGISYYLCKIKAITLTTISYVARRGESEEQGAVQRILNKARISGIKDYILNGGFFPNNIILNFVKLDNISINENGLTITVEERIAQIIDGQHRVEGLRDAIKEDSTKGNLEFPILLTINLDTAKCAEIFVSINTEQKSVPKSLIYDLYGVINIPNRDFSIDRGTDISEYLNKNDSSPYQGFIKFPGSRRFKGGIQLSTFVNNLRPLVKRDGEFNKYFITTLEYQANILANYFKAIEYYYEREWESLKNPFLYASGFGAAIDIFISRILPYSYSQRNFREDFFRSIIVIPKVSLIWQSQVKGMSGEAAREHIRGRLSGFVNILEANEEDFAI